MAMEVDQGEGSVVTNAAGSVSVFLHPLVVMNISEHFTRVRVQGEDPSPGSYYKEGHFVSI